MRADQVELGTRPVERLRDDGELALDRFTPEGESRSFLRFVPSVEEPGAVVRRRLENEYQLRDCLEEEWAIVPLELQSDLNGIALLCKDPGGLTLDRLIKRPSNLRRFLHIASGLASALHGAHAAGLIHRELRPSNILVGRDGKFRLTGFGNASRLLRERQMFDALELGAGGWPYLAPEQTGRLNRSVDHRSDLYALGIILYELLVGALPFTGQDLRDWAYSHVARVPPPPSARVERVPSLVEQIVLKLLAKDAEDRYQTATGLRHDLDRCAEAASRGDEPEPFALGERDLATRIILPEKLYGRDEVARRLIDLLDHVASHESFEFVLVSGETGAGKTALVGELRKAVFARNGFFAAGKFDPFQRNVPYVTLGEAFRSLFRQLLSLDEGRLAPWRSALREALGESGLMMTKLFPELALIVGEQAALPPLSPQEAKNRFRLIFMRFLGVFAAPEHPLVLFFDDLQWLDPATCELLELIAGDEQVPNLLLVGTYRSNEVRKGHPLRLCLDRIAERRGDLAEIALTPLRPQDIAQLLGEALRLSPPAARELGELVWEKTRGNPFFTTQFITMLGNEGLLSFDYGSASWTYDAAKIRSQAITVNVAALLAERLKRYKGVTLEAAKQLACLGDNAADELLVKLLPDEGSGLDSAMHCLVRDGLVQRVDQRYRFAHDSVREAAYALIPKRNRPAIHLAIGRALIESQPGREAATFDGVDQLNRGHSLIADVAERFDLASLNLVAGRRAKAGAAYEPARSYLQLGQELLDDRNDEPARRLRFEIEFHLADCEFMTGLTTSAEQRLKQLSANYERTADLGLVVGRQLLLYTYLGRYDHAIDLSLGCLAEMGLMLPKHPVEEDLQQEYRRFQELLAGRPLDAMSDLPKMTEPRQLEIISALADLFTPAGTVNTDLHHLAALRLANLSLEYGIAQQTPHGLACLSGQVFGWRIGSFADAKVLGRVAMDLVEQKGFDHYASRVYAVISGTIGPWSRPLSDCYRIAVRATEIGREHGAVTYSGYAWGCALTALLDSGRSLAEVERQAEASLAALAKLPFPLVVDFMTAQRQVARALRGSTEQLDNLSDTNFDEAGYRERLEQEPHLWHALVRYRIRKLQLHCIAGDFESALSLLTSLEPEVYTLRVFELAEYHFYSALTRAACLIGGQLRDNQKHRDLVIRSHARLQEWSLLCPQNFGCRAMLVGAEMAHLEGHWVDAERMYEDAVEAAERDGFQQVEALAHELAARSYARRGLRTSAEAHLAKARSAYERWGAIAKAHQLDRTYGAAAGAALAAVTTPSSAEQLDLKVALGMYQTISREIVFDRLIERLMTTAIEHAGATRGLLLLSQQNRLRIVAEATSDQNDVTVSSRRPAHFAGELPESLLNYAARTHEVIIIDDAEQPNAHSGDPYIVRVRPRSVLCLPLVKQSRLVGVLYLENQLTSHVFTADRVAVLQFVASQAAISIENAELFQDIQRTQDEVRRASEEVRRSFDMIPALAWSASPEGKLEFSNKQWHDYTGLSEREAHGLTWLQAFHPDDLDRIAAKWRKLQKFLASGEFEARMRRFDGVYRRFLVRLTPMIDDSGEVVRWHGTNTDIDELKQIEDAQEALARASRVTAMGALTVSIAHEVNQPLMAIVTNAATCLRWLSAEQPQVNEARLAAERIIRDGHRAGEVIASIRSMARNASPSASRVDLAEVTAEILQLMRGELDRSAISVRTDFAKPAVAFGDRTQIQQVVLNLIVNGIEAIQASEGKGRSIKIGASLADGPFVNLWVADSGVGLAPAMRERVFDAFFTTKAEGIGIGLSICRTIVENHGGRLWVTANKPAGAVFHVSLPIWADEQIV